MATIYIGLSGYSYKPWQGPGRFYPEELKQPDFLHYYATRYLTVELDGIWYRLPSDGAVRAWTEQTPAGFMFSPKTHRQITHVQRLKPESLSMLQAMLTRLVPLAEAKKLGPVLLQLPPNFKRDDNRLASFLSELPRSHQWAIEYRHESWHVPEVEQLLRRYGIAWASVETDERQAEYRDTADFLYARLRRSRYSSEDLKRWAKRLRSAREQGKTCFVYCKHEDTGSPWIWADELKKLTGQSYP